MRAAATAGGRLYVGVGRRIVVLDLTDPRAPRRVGTTQSLPAEVDGLAAANGVLVAAAGDAGLVVFDLAVPNSPQVTGSVPLPGYAEAVTLAGQHAFVADGTGGLRVVDVANPSAPVELGAAYDLHNVLDVAVTPSHAFLAGADEGLLVADITDPAAPREVGGLYTGGFAFAVATRNATAYLADGWGGLGVIDVSDPRTPRKRATLPTSAWAMDVAVRGDHAYLASGADGLRIVDVGDGSQPVELGALPLPRGHAVSVVVRKGLAYVSDINQGIHVVDVGSASHPSRVALYNPMGNALGVAVQGRYAYVAAGAFGLRVVDLSDPSRPRQVGVFRSPDPVMTVAAMGTNVFITLTPGSHAPSIVGLDASDPTHLKAQPMRALTGHPGGWTFPPEEAIWRGPFPAMNAQDVAVQGKALYYSAEIGLLMVDGRRPAPCELGFLQTSRGDAKGGTGGVSVAGDVAYLGISGAGPPQSGEEGVYAVDVADPRAPRLLSKATAPGASPLGFGASQPVGSTLYALNGDLLHAFDISDPGHPRFLASLRLPGVACRGFCTPLAYAGGKLFVADGGAGLVVVDVSRPDAPQIAGRIRLPGKVASVVADERYAYVASDGGGLFVVEWAPSQPTGSLAQAALAGRTLPSHTHFAVSAWWRGRAPSGEPTDGHRSAGSPTCTVTTTAQGGPGSLRECLKGAEADDTITFDPDVFPADQPAAIRLQKPLPPVRAKGLTIDATGAGVILDGGGVVDTGILVRSTDSSLKGLQIVNFKAAGVQVEGSRTTLQGNVISGNGTGALPNAGVFVAPWTARNRLIGNFIGTDATGTKLGGKQPIGLYLTGERNVIGGTESGDRNVISGNIVEVNVQQAFHNTLAGNYIGTDLTGTSVLRSPDASSRALVVQVEAGSNTFAGNVIAGDVTVDDPGSSYNAFVGNRICVDATGMHQLCRGSIGVFEPFNRIGGTGPGEGNIIIWLSVETHDTIVLGNLVGTDKDGQPFPGPADGVITLTPEAQHSVIGGRTEGARNVVAGGCCAKIRLFVGAQANVVIGNEIGTDGSIYSIGQGVAIEGSGRNQVVANTIAGARGGAIILSDGAYANSIRGNRLLSSEVGLHAQDSVDNLIHLNAFLNNVVNARDEGTANRWDDGSRGNYWSDYTGADADGNGIGDVPYQVPPNGVDRYPLMAPITPSGSIPRPVTANSAASSAKSLPVWERVSSREPHLLQPGDEPPDGRIHVDAGEPRLHEVLLAVAGLDRPVSCREEAAHLAPPINDFPSRLDPLEVGELGLGLSELGRDAVPV